MKQMILVLQILIVMASLAYCQEQTSNGDIKPTVFAGIIRDTSPTSEKSWNIQNSVNLEIIHILKSGDRLKEWVAYPGKLSVISDTIITDKGTENKRLINNISDISKELFFPADIAAAMESAFDSFREKEKEYRCFLIIICRGNLGDNQIAQIRRYAGAFKVRGWPVCFVCDKEQASRKLLVAANNKEFDIHFLDKCSLYDWIANISGGLKQKSSKDAPSAAKSKPQHDNEQLKTEESKASPTVVLDIGVKQPLAVKIIDPPQPKLSMDINMPKEVPSSQGTKASTAKVIELPQSKLSIDINKPKQVTLSQLPKSSTVKIIEPPQSKFPSDTNRPKKKYVFEKSNATKSKDAPNKTYNYKKSNPPKLNILPIIILPTIIFGLIIILWYLAAKQPLKPISRGDENTEKQNHLIALVYDQRFDLGHLDALGEVTVGKGIGSTVYINKEAVEDKHLRIFSNRKGLKIQNLAPLPITVNGVELLSHKKTILDLPADIQLTPDVAITFLAEPLEIDKEANSYETEAI